MYQLDVKDFLSKFKTEFQQNQSKFIAKFRLQCILSFSFREKLFNPEKKFNFLILFDTKLQLLQSNISLLSFWLSVFLILIRKDSCFFVTT